VRVRVSIKVRVRMRMRMRVRVRVKARVRAMRVRIRIEVSGEGGSMSKRVPEGVTNSVTSSRCHMRDPTLGVRNIGQRRPSHTLAVTNIGH